MVAERVMLIERREVAGPDDYPTDPDLQKWVHEAGSAYIGDQKVRVTHSRLRHVVHGAVPLQSYVPLQSPGQFAEEWLENILRGGSAEHYTETVIDSARRSACRRLRCPRRGCR